MADSPPTPEQINALTEAFKVVGAINPVLAQVLGAVIAIIGIVRAVLTTINNNLTKKNNESQEKLTTLLTTSKTEIETVKNDAVKEIKEAVTDFKKVLQAESDKLKKGVAIVNRESTQKLGMIPRVQDALGKQEDRLARIERKVAALDPLIRGVKDKFGGKKS